MKQDASFVKTRRLEQIAKQIAKGFSSAPEIHLKKLMLWIEMNIGLTKIRALEYIETVCEAKGWELDQDKEIITKGEE